MRVAIFIETRIVVFLCKLDTRNRLLLIGEVYGIAECMPSCIVREFCKAVAKHLWRVLIQFPSELQLQFKVLASQFKALNKIPYIVGTIDGSYIHVLAPIIGRRIITVINHSTQQFYKELLMWIASFGIFNLGGLVIFTIGLFLKWQK